jgi:hypothetical protein
MTETYQYRGQEITVSATPTNSSPAGYIPSIVITGVIQILDPKCPYPPHQFPTEADALKYAKEAAHWIVDGSASAESEVEDAEKA